MKKIVITLFATIALFSSCKKDSSTETEAEECKIENIVDGGSCTIEDVDLSKEGTITVKSNTTVYIKGDVKFDVLVSNGIVIVENNATLTANEIDIQGGTSWTVRGKVITNVLTQIGHSSYFDGADVTIKNKFTINGGATMYLINSVVRVNELVVIGHIQAIKNNHTDNSNKYSVIESIDQKYINRAGGTHVCGPVVYTHNFDNGYGSSNQPFINVTNTILSEKPDIKNIYGLDDNSSFYQYNDQIGCNPLDKFPN